MTDLSPEERSNGQQILESMNKWILSVNEIEKMKILNELNGRLEKENQFFKDFMEFKREIYLRDRRLERDNKSKSDKRQKLQ